MPTILVIDDDKGYGNFLEDYLSALGLDAYLMPSGKLGLEFSKRVRPNLILLDWVLKGSLSGEETLRSFKSQPQTKDVPVIVISGIRESAEDEMRARRAGAALFMTKGEISDDIKDRNVFQRHLQALLLGHELAPLKPRAAAMKKLPATMRDAGRVLVIDDDADVRDMLSTVLHDKGYTVITADKGASGLIKAQQEHPDLVILDLSLPDIDGLEVCSQLKAYPKTRALPILLLTARASTQAKILAVEYGADHYFTKPIPDLDEFHNWVAAFLRRKSHFDDTSVIRVGDHLVIDTLAHTLTVKDRVVKNVPATLFRLLCEFARRPGEVLERDYLVHSVWNNRVQGHNVDTSVGRLKGYIGPVAKDWFMCVAKKGFRMLPVAPGDGTNTANN